MKPVQRLKARFSPALRGAILRCASMIPLLGPSIGSCDEERGIEHQISALVNVAVPAVEYEKTRVADAVDTLNEAIRALDPPPHPAFTIRMELSAPARDASLTMQGNDLPFHEVLGRIADAANAELLVTRTGYLLRGRQPNPADVPAEAPREERAEPNDELGENGYLLKDAKLNDVLVWLAQKAELQYWHNPELAKPHYNLNGLMNPITDPVRQIEDVALSFELTVRTRGETLYVLTSDQDARWIAGKLEVRRPVGQTGDRRPQPIEPATR